MDSQLITECAKHAVMVRARGQDSLGVKTLGRPFHKISGGYTTLSASGLLLDKRSGLVMTSATLLAPFMQGDALRKGVVVEILTNGLSGVLEEEEPSAKWIPAKLVRILKDDTIKSILTRFKGDSDWIAGWPRNSDSSSGHLGEMDLPRRESMSTSFWAGFEDIALLQLECDAANQASGRRAKILALKRDQPPQIDLTIVDPSTIKRGNHLLLIASPYGILSPSVFHNCVYTAMVSNVISLQTDATTPTSDADFSESSAPAPSSAPSSAVGLQPKSRTQRLKTAVLSNFPPSVPPHPCILLIDQPGLPGCEGGPIFDSAGSLVGLLAPPLRRSDGSNVEVHLVLPIQPFLVQLRENKGPLIDRLSLKKTEIKLAPAAAETKGVRRAISSDSPVMRPRSLLSHPAMPDSTEIAKRTLPAIVVISTGTFWGSGVMISSSGFILTAAHIFRAFLASSSTALKPVLKSGYHVDIRIDSDEGGTASILNDTPPRPRWYRASLVFISSSHLDVAIVKIDKPPSGLTVLPICGGLAYIGGNNSSANIAAREPSEGEPVLALGYALFGPSKRVKATVTSGVISRVANLHGQPKLVQTSAIVNKGASGGAIVDSTGQFVGLVTCNAMTKDGVIIPKINFSIPSGVLAPVAEFVRNPSAPGASDVLLSIETKDPDCASLWSMSALSDEPDPLPTRPAPGGYSSDTSSVPVSLDGQRGAKLIEFWNNQLPSHLPPNAQRAKL